MIELIMWDYPSKGLARRRTSVSVGRRFRVWCFVLGSMLSGTRWLGANLGFTRMGRMNFFLIFIRNLSMEGMSYSSGMLKFSFEICF